jgi:hypothetical protein
MPNWGNPVTPHGFIWMVSASAYRGYAFALPLSYLPARLSAWAGGLLTQFGIWGLLLGLTGLCRVAERDSRRALSEGLAFVLYSAYAIGYNTADSYVYLIPTYLVFALWIGEGLHHLLGMLRERCGHRSSLPRLTLALTAILPIIPLVSNHASLDLSSDVQAAEYGADIMRSLPAGATVISASDGHTFSLWYAREVLQPRPDVVLLDQDLLQYRWYIQNLESRHPQLSLPSDACDQCALLDTLFADADDARVVYLTDPDEDLCAGYQLSSEGPPYRVRPVGRN